MKRVLGLAVAGALLVAVMGAARADLVANGGFETGDFTSWTQSGNTGFTGVTNDPAEGVYSAYFGPVGSMGYITQTISTTPGQTYTLSFMLKNFDPGPNAFSVQFAGSTLMGLTDAPDFDWTPYSFGVTASGSSSDLEFGFRNDPSYSYLDDVRLEPSDVVPEGGTLAALGLFLVTGGAWLRRRCSA